MPRLTKSALLALAAGGIIIVSSTVSACADSFDNPYFPGQLDALQSGTSIETGHRVLNLFEHDSLSSSKFSGSMSSGILNFGVDSEFRDTTKLDGNSFLGVVFGNNAKWQQNQVGYTNISADMGEAIRVKTRFGASTYGASEQFFTSLGKSADDQRALRFASTGLASGSASLTRVEEDVLRLGEAKVTIFQEFARVDRFFEDLKFSDKSQRQQTKDDVFSKPDRETAKYGASLSQGSSGISVSQSSISNIIDDPVAFYRESRIDSRAWLGARDLFKSYGNSESSLLGSLLPSNIWLGYGAGEVKRADVLLPNSSVVDASAGANWQWDRFYTSVGLWRSTQSGPELITNFSATLLSEGADFSVGLRNDRWSLNGYVSLSRSKFDYGLANLNNATNFNASGGASLTLILERWPNVTFGFDLSKYGDTYVAGDGVDAGRVTTAGLAFDCSKYLPERNGHKLQLFYYARHQELDTQSGGIQTHSSSLAHVFGGMARFRW